MRKAPLSTGGFFVFPSSSEQAAYDAKKVKVIAIVPAPSIHREVIREADRYIDADPVDRGTCRTCLMHL